MLLIIITKQLLFPIKSGILVFAQNRHRTSSFSLPESYIPSVAKNHHLNSFIILTESGLLTMLRIVAEFTWLIPNRCLVFQRSLRIVSESIYSPSKLGVLVVAKNHHYFPPQPLLGAFTPFTLPIFSFPNEVSSVRLLGVSISNYSP